MEHKDEKMDILFKVMDNENDVTLTDGKGVVIRISDSYEKHYNVSKDEVIGKSIWELEDVGIFKPSVTAIVLEKKCKATILQKNMMGESILTTGVPIFDDEGEIEYVISFNSIDIANMNSLQEKYNKLTELMQAYNEEINALRMEEIKDKELVTKSNHMEKIKTLVDQVADTHANILITGETGVGKSMIAKIVHQKSGRVDGPFVEINCGTIHENLIESELFGYEKGAFTGANEKGKMGKIELANGGTLFLDEIGELSLGMQMKLLQAIQEKEITRVGGLNKIKVDFRLIAATNRDLKKRIKENLFREDLYYRLNVIPISIHPLRDRPDDIRPLVENFLVRANGKYNRNVTIQEEAIALLEKHSWPGNIRQVENLVERLVIMSVGDLVTAFDLPTEIRYGGRSHYGIGETDSLKEILESVEKQIVKEAYEKGGTSIAVGKTLKISQATAARKLRKYIPGYAEQPKKEGSQ